jgi:DNA-directed RNA polymerase
LADSSIVYDGLNALGSVPWRINERILKVANRCWENNIPIGDIPQHNDFEVPPEPIPPESTTTKLEKGTPEHTRLVDETRKYREVLAKYDRIRQKNMVRVANS